MSDEAVIDIQKENEAMSKGGKVVVREYYEFRVDAEELKKIEDGENVCDFYEDTNLVSIEIYEIKRDEEETEDWFLAEKSYEDYFNEKKPDEENE